jgi:hypothetical protein
MLQTALQAVAIPAAPPPAPTLAVFNFPPNNLLTDSDKEQLVNFLSGKKPADGSKSRRFTISELKTVELVEPKEGVLKVPFEVVEALTLELNYDQGSWKKLKLRRRNAIL